MMPFPFLFGDKDGDKDGKARALRSTWKKKKTLPLCSLVKNLHADETSSQTPPPLDDTT